jgi:hypothetical protein
VTQDKPDLGEQALSKVVEAGIANQLDAVEQMEVDVRTDPLKLVQGKVDSVSIAGEGMVTNQNLRLESVEITTGTVAVNPLSAVLGKVDLTKPTDAEARIVLTEADINRALRSDYLREKMQNMELRVQAQPVTIDIQQAELRLPNSSQIALTASIFVQETGETKHLSAVAIPSIQDDGQRIALEISSAEAKGLSLEFATALFKKILELLDLRNFDMPGVSLRLKQLSVEEGRLLLQALTKVKQIPST